MEIGEVLTSFYRHDFRESRDVFNKLPRRGNVSSTNVVYFTLSSMNITKLQYDMFIDTLLYQQ
jgi:hypothetical protein